MKYFYTLFNNYNLDITLEERKLQYIQNIEIEYATPADKSWWQHPPPSYHLTKEYADKYNKAVIPGEPVVFKKTKKEGMILAVMLIVASLLIYMVGKKEFGITYVLFLILLLIVVLPILLNTKTMIRVSRESIWLHKDDRDISWKQVLLTYIKETHEESHDYFFIVHYYDEGADDFKRIEVDLEGLVSAELLSATVEAYKKD